MHPMNHARQHKVEKSRVSKMTRGYASGGAVRCDEPDEERKRGGKVEKHVHAPEGKKAKRRADRVMRAKGGKVGHGKKGATHVNVIVNGGDKGAGGPMPMPPPAMAAPPPMPAGPVAGVGGPPPGAGGPPPGMPPMPGRAKGGKVKHREDGGDVQSGMRANANASYDRATGKASGFAKGGAVKSGPAWKEGVRNGTQVSHRAGKASTNTPENLDRGRQITFATGGGVVSFKARGGKVEASGKMGGGPKMDGGVLTGEGRMQQASRAKRGYARPMKETNGAD